MKISTYLISCIALVLALAACGKPEPPKEHFLQDQVDAMDKAKEVEGMMQESVDERMKDL